VKVRSMLDPLGPLMHGHLGDDEPMGVRTSTPAFDVPSSYTDAQEPAGS
jgi:hypothetical protein